MSDEYFYQDDGGYSNTNQYDVTTGEMAYRTYIQKCLPVLAIGIVIWLASTLSINSLILMYQTWSYILVYVSYFILWFVTIYLASSGRNKPAMVLFFITSYLNGLAQAPLILWGASILGSYAESRMVFILAAVLSLIAVSAALTMGMMFKDKINEKWMYAAFVGLIFVGITEFVLFLIFGTSMTWLFWTSALMLGIIMITIVYDGAHLKETITQSWMLATLNIFIDFVIVTVRLFIILLKIFSDSR